VVWVGCIGYGRVPEVGKPNLLPGGQTETELMMMPFTKFVLAETINIVDEVPSLGFPRVTPVLVFKA
jgi:hypothetical protein